MNILKPVKAQAALEFLTTYGWAFLIIFIMISTLAYFGILNPSKILPNRCTFSSEFSCVDHQLKAEEVRVKIKNNLGEPIDVSSITLTKDDGAAFAGCIQAPASPITGWRSGEIKDISWTGCTASSTGLISGNKGKALVNIKYYSSLSGSTYTKESQGEVYSAVQ